MATGATAETRDARVEEAYPPVGPIIDTGLGGVHHVTRGSGPDVVLLHGAGGNLRDFTFDLMDRLAPRYRVTAFDRPGLGYTDRVPGVARGPFATEGDPPLAQAAMLREAAAKLGLRRPIVTGHSFGGIVAMAWALAGLDTEAEVNAAGIVSLAGVLMPWPGELGAYYKVNGSAFGGAVTVPLISAFASDGRVREALTGIFAPQPVPDGYFDHIGPRLTLRVDSFRANVRQVNTLRPHVVEMQRRYPDLTLPIEIVHGTADTTVPIHVHPQEMVKIVDSARLTPLEGIGHMPHHAAPEAAIAAIDRAATRAGLL